MPLFNPGPQGKAKLFTVFLVLLCGFQFSVCENVISLSTQDLTIKLGEYDLFVVKIRNYTNPSVDEKLEFRVQHSDILKVNQSVIDLKTETSIPISIEAIGAGHSEVYANSSDPQLNLDDIFVRVTVYKNYGLDVFAVVIGWIYFVAWSISFYPQIYENYKRKSVVGLNFDFLALNLIGFTLYGIFNLGLYFIPEMQEEYSNRYPRGLNPVLINDIVFAVHAVFATLITIAQCFMYERDDQRVSITAKSIMGIFAIVTVVSIILAWTSVFHWLDFLYVCSYVKLTITLIKYIPQAYMNYKRKSTLGWSIGNIFLDFTGGILSMLQMILNAYNYDDWVSIFGDPTKFGLGLFSVVFDIFFIIQHYVLYKVTNYEEKS